MKLFSSVLLVAMMAYAPAGLSCACEDKKGGKCECSECACAKGESCEHHKGKSCEKGAACAAKKDDKKSETK